MLALEWKLDAMGSVTKPIVDIPLFITFRHVRKVSQLRPAISTDTCSVGSFIELQVIQDMLVNNLPC